MLLSLGYRHTMINSLFRLFTKKRLAQIEYFKDNGAEVQSRVLGDLIRIAKDTQWGVTYDYQGIHSIDDFKKRVPVSTYENLFHYIDRMMRGEQNVLWPTPIKWFGKSAGTTSNRSKFIPVSDESLNENYFQGGKDAVALYIQQNPETNILKGKNIQIGGSLQENKLHPDTFYGDISAVAIKNLPLLGRFLSTPSTDVRLMSDWEEKVERIIDITSKEDVVSIAGVPSWTAVLLKRLLEVEGTKDIFDIWPNLELFMHGGVSFKPYRHLFDELISSGKIKYMEIYNGAEGFFAVQDDLHKKDEMLLLLDNGIFYEFIPMEEVEKDNPKTLTLDRVELDKNYALVISTNGGLWRYMNGDTIQFTSLSPYRIKVSGRTKHFINAFGEEVIIDNAERAVSEACSVAGAIVSDFTAAPVFMKAGKTGAHEWLIEFEREPTDFDKFKEVLDTTLRDVNSDYDAKRYKDMLLRSPIVRSVPQGTFYKWMKKRGKLGGQNKVPRLSNTREYIEDILVMMQ